MTECLTDTEYIDMSLEEVISGIVLQPFKPDIVNDIAVLDSVFETDILKMMNTHLLVHTSTNIGNLG